MSWSFTINQVVQEFELPVSLVEDLATQHLSYPSDAMLALDIAKRAGFKSCVCTGFRTPTPYSADEVTEISVKGTTLPVDFNEMIKDMIIAGPACVHVVQNGICIRCSQRMDVLSGREG